MTETQAIVLAIGTSVMAIIIFIDWLLGDL